MRQQIEAIDKDRDVYLFIQEKQTGTERPKPSDVAFIPMRLVCCFDLHLTQTRTLVWVLASTRTRFNLRTCIVPMTRMWAVSLLHWLEAVKCCWAGWSGFQTLPRSCSHWRMSGVVRLCGRRWERVGFLCWRYHQDYWKGRQLRVVHRGIEWKDRVGVCSTLLTSGFSRQITQKKFDISELSSQSRYCAWSYRK